MKGIIFDIKRFAIHDGPGLRTTIFFKGCPLSCWWCHNPESINANIETYISTERLGDAEFIKNKKIGRWVSLEELFVEIDKEKIFMEEGAGGVTLSGGEPLMQVEFAKQILQRCKENGIHTTVDTSGAVSLSSIKKVIPFTDLFLYDIKAMNAEIHKKYTGLSNELIVSNLKYIVNAGNKLIVRIPVVPEVNCNLQEVELMLDFLLPLKGENFNEINLLPYHHMGKSKYARFIKSDRMKGVKEPLKNELLPIEAQFKNAGFKVQIHH